ncbi:histidinol-phosphatase [Xanthobacter tagetidis]|uniref:Histidinol-phosphatase n=1 Tax=Xanthobacter tagetidis TaxID=60216 RepID=A0A3L7A6D8_9HYPH|nr:histidinol-phosphatase [Xanthobacter tagetidis]MBB6310027.1 histidinol phosphatase-like enzyme (inositol monophosphatase family) [Xanthobacter tagetidis]RLP75131.1 histidinol-phosphatase [Xanthobacter tagetidis]
MPNSAAALRPAVPDAGDLAAFAEQLADLARPIVRSYFRTPVGVEWKADLSPVTVADTAVERALREAIAARFPDHGILGEEEAAVGIDRPVVWVVDPIDGTKSFMTGLPLFGTLIAAVAQGRAEVGVIEVPALGDRWIGIAGAGTRFNGAPCSTSAAARLGEARLYATSPDMFAPAEGAAFGALAQKVALRRFGGDCYAYGLVACGHVDLVVEAGLKPYDYMALVPVVEGAGGVITDWRGAPLTIASGGQVVAAATAALHAAALAELQPAAR